MLIHYNYEKKFNLTKMCLMKNGYQIQKMNETCMYLPANILNNEKGNDKKQKNSINTIKTQEQ